MRLRGIAQAIGVFDAQFQLSAGDLLEDVARTLLEIFTGGNIVPERGAGEE